MSNSLLVTLCTYNERANIEQLIPDLFSFVPDAELLIIDDNSPDGTGEYVQALADENPKIHVIHRSGKLGLGTATVAAFQFGVDNDYDLLLNMDADFSHPPRFIPEMISQAEKFDVVIGSRYVPGGKIIGWGPKRHFMSKSINLYARAMLGLKTKDNSGSFRCYHVNKLAEVDWSQAQSVGYAVQEEILYCLRKRNATFSEVPIVFEERRYGVSKISWKEAVSAGWGLLSLRFKQ